MSIQPWQPVPDRRARYWAAVERDLTSGRTVDAVLRLVDEEQADLVKRISGGTDDELARRLEWATGRNGHTLLAQIRGEGLGVMVIEQEVPQ